MHKSLSVAGALVILTALAAGCADSSSTTTGAESASVDKAQTESPLLGEVTSIVGVGLVLAANANNFPEVQRLIIPSPANTAGILQGDKILAVNGESVFDKSLEEVVSRLRGPAQSQVEVTLEHSGTPRTIRLTRQVIASAPE